MPDPIPIRPTTGLRPIDLVTCARPEVGRRDMDTGGRDVCLRQTGSLQPEPSPAAVEYAQLERDAGALVRQVKDLAYDDAVVLVIETLVVLKRTTQDVLLDEVESRLGRVL